MPNSFEVLNHVLHTGGGNIWSILSPKVHLIWSLRRSFREENEKFWDLGTWGGGGLSPKENVKILANFWWTPKMFLRFHKYELELGLRVVQINHDISEWIKSYNGPDPTISYEANGKISTAAAGSRSTERNITFLPLPPTLLLLLFSKLLNVFLQMVKCICLKC